ncbi:MAG: transcription antitermination factor NusB [Deltaproteobacteria bacterium]|nr:transcription antitermination factor NusB [Deltaproteobacteria bacterium]
MGGRRQAREQALQLLYQVDLGQRSVDDAFRLFWDDEEEPTEPDVVEFARILARGVRAQTERIDELISDASINWKIRRMSLVDRNILRIAVFEFIGRDDIPAMVSINEAIELGKRFGTTDSGGFINGILDRIARNLGLTAGGKGRR